jgi:Tol biopolymer transport system component
MLLAGLFLSAAPAHSAFPGRNGKIAFQSDRDGNNEIYTMNADGSSQTRRTTNAVPDNEPGWSADGAQIAFHSSRDGNAEVYTMNADGNGQTRGTSNGTGDGQATWSPAGDWIVFNTDRDGNFEIYSMRADGTSPTRRTTNVATDTVPVWAPDGSKIAFQSDRDGNYEIYTMNPDGTGQTRRTTNAAQDADASWSPDGTKVAFTSNRDGNFELYTMNADGTGLIRRTTNAATDSEPAWSPDGTQIAFTSNRDGNFEVYTMNADGSGQTRRTNNPAADLYPDWQPVSYQHPENEVSMDVPLVPVLRQTVSPSQCSGRGGTPSQHTAPFAVTSCDPPAPTPGTSAYLGGAGDDKVTIIPTSGNPITTSNEADITLSAFLSDIRAGNLEGTDYNPDLTLMVRLRITDKRNCSPPGCGAPYMRQGTTADVDFSVPVSCADTVDPAMGATCTTNTTANAVAPGTVLESRQAVVDAFRFKVNDAGPDQIAGNADDKLFAQQGTFIP